MKDKAPIIILVIVAAGLMLALIVVNNKAKDQREQDSGKIQTLSNAVTSVQSQLDEQKSVNRTLETNLASTTTDYSNKLTSTQSQLAGVQGDLAKAEADAKAQAEAAAAAIAQRDKKISDLENQNQELDKQSLDLHNSISSLEGKIADTQKKLAASEGDRTELIKELKELQAKKDELEKRFNDLAALKDQIHKLKEELSIARRLDWIRRGIYESMGMKGGERMIHPITPLPTNTNSSLNVELHQNGEIKVQAPPPSKSN
jgi:chromosome segregation ATPase